MIGLEDRRDTARKILKAQLNGARLHLACEIAGIDIRTLQRWKGGRGLTAGDGRPAAVHPTPAGSVAIGASEHAKPGTAFEDQRASE